MFLSNKDIDVKEKHDEEKEVILENGDKSDAQHQNTNETMKHDLGKTMSEKRIDTIDADEMGNLCHQFRIL